MSFKIIIQGDYALFTRPEMKVERVSYDVPTPSALEGLLKSIYWKPAIRYVIDEIVVYNPIKFTNVRRNEVAIKISDSKVKSQMNGKSSNKEEKSPIIYTSDNGVRSQRASMILKDVKYGVRFHFELTGLKSERDDDDREKHYNIILRRLSKGQCFRQPCLGCSEFPVKKIELVENFNFDEIHESLKGDVDLGFMLYGLKFQDGGIPINKDWKNPVFSDNADALYYRPHMVDGVIHVCDYRRNIKC